MRPKTVKRCQKLHVRYLVTAALNQTDRSPPNLAVHDFAPNVCFGAMTKIGRTTGVGAQQPYCGQFSTSAFCEIRIDGNSLQNDPTLLAKSILAVCSQYVVPANPTSPQLAGPLRRCLGG